MPEIVRLIDDDEVIIFLFIIAVTFDDFFKAAVGDKTAVFVFEAEILESVLPVSFNRRRKDDENSGAVAIGGDKPLRNHGRHHGFAQTHNVGNKASAVPHHNVVPLYHSVALVGEIFVIVRKMRDEIVFDLIAEMVDEHPHIEFIRCRLMFRRREMSPIHDAVHVIQSHG